MRKFLPFILTIMFSAAASAQSADVVSEILDTKEATFGQICYLSAVQQKLVDNDATYGQSISALYENGQLPSMVYETTPMVMADLAFIYSRMWHIRGGVFYRLTGGSPRYAFKQMKADGIFPNRTDPADSVSGREALNILTSCMMTYGGMKLESIGE